MNNSANKNEKIPQNYTHFVKEVICIFLFFVVVVCFKYGQKIFQK